MKKISVNLGTTLKEIVMTDAKALRVEDAVCKAYGYKEKITDAEGKEIDNPKSRDEFVKDQIQRFLEEITVAHEKNKAREDAAAAVTPISLS